MIPPKELNVLDQHSGFTAITKLGTLWRPRNILKKTTIGTLQSFNEKSFYQNDNNVTSAIYKVPGYPYKVEVWFSNRTGERIA